MLFQPFHLCLIFYESTSTFIPATYFTYPFQIFSFLLYLSLFIPCSLTRAFPGLPLPFLPPAILSLFFPFMYYPHINYLLFYFFISVKICKLHSFLLHTLPVLHTLPLPISLESKFPVPLSILILSLVPLTFPS